MDQRKIIALTGPTGSGKDTLAERYRKERGYYHTKFADGLRSAYYQTFGNDLSKAGEREYESGFINQLILYSRTVLEWHPMLWVTLWERTLPPDRDVVISDLRQPRELARVRELGGVALRVDRPKNPYPPRPLDALLQRQTPLMRGVFATQDVLPEPLAVGTPEPTLLPKLPHSLPSVLSQGSTPITLQDVIDGIRYLQDQRNP